MKKSKKLPSEIDGLPENAHMVSWDHKKIADYWDIFGNIRPKAPWFSEKAASWLVRSIKSEITNRKIRKDNLSIIDLGAGSGQFLNKLTATFGARVSGLDISPERISQAKKVNSKGDVISRMKNL